VASGSTLQFTDGTHFIDGIGLFSLSSGATLGIKSADGINLSNTSGHLRNSGGKALNAAANYLYNGTGNQNTGTQLGDGVNIAFSDGGIKTFNGSPSDFTGNFSVASGTSVALGSSGTDHTALTLTLGEEGANNLTWGSTAAATADHKQATYFGTNGTGRLAVTTPTCSTGNQTASIASNNGDINGKICSGTNAIFNLKGTANATISYKLNGTPNIVVLNGSGIATLTITGATATQALVLTKVTSSTTFCETTLSASSTINIKTVPVITTQPNTSNATITYGANASFSVVATNGGDVSSEMYQWQVKVGTGSFTDISGANASTLTFTLPTVAMSGYLYKCIITNSCGNFATDEVTLTVNKAATITTVTMAAGPFPYTGSPQTPATVLVTGAGGLSLTLTPTYADNTNAGTAKASYSYTGDANYLASSDSKTFTIGKFPLTITAKNQTACQNALFIFAGTEFTYSPSFLPNGEIVTRVTLTSSTAIAGAIPIVPTLATGDNGFLASNYAINYLPGTFTVNPSASQANTGPVSMSSCPGQPIQLGATPVPVITETGSWTVVASPLSPTVTGTPVSGAGRFQTGIGSVTSTSTDPTAKFIPIHGYGSYTLRWTVTNVPLCTPTSDDIVINLQDIIPPTFVSPNANIPDQILFVDASCEVPKANYVIPTTATIAIATTDNCAVQSLTNDFATSGLPTNLTAGPTGTNAYNITWTVTDFANLTATYIQKIIVKDNITPIIAGCPSTVTVTPAAGQCTQTATWTEPTATDNCTPSGSLVWSKTVLLAGATTPIPVFSGQTFPVGTHSVTYTATDVAGNISTACTFSVVVNPNTTAMTVISGGGTVCANATLSNLIFTSVGTGPWAITYTDGSASYSISATTSPFSVVAPTPTSAGTKTFAVTSITSASGCVGLYSGSAVVLVNPIPVLSSTLSPTAICSAATFGYTATSATSGASFAWTRATVTGITEMGTTGTANVSETLTNSTTAPIVVTYSYITTANGCSSASQDVTVTVNPSTKITTQPIAANYCKNATATALSVAASGTGTITYEWFSNTGSSTTNNILVGTEATFTPPTSTVGSVWYYAVATSPSCGTSTSNIIEIKVNPLPTATIAVNIPTICQNGISPITTLTGANGTAPYTFSYKIGLTGSIQTTTSNGNIATFNVPASTVGVHEYILVSVADNNTCSQTQTGSATVTVNPLPTPAAVASPTFTACPGISFTMNGNTIANGTGTWTVTSSPGATSDAGIFSDIHSSTSTFTTAQGLGLYTFRWTVVSTYGCSSSDAFVTVTIQDATPPTFNPTSLLAPISIVANTTGCTTSQTSIQDLLPTNPLALATDNCVGVQSVTNNLTTLPLTVGIHNLVWTAKDFANNTATYTQVITVTNPVSVVTINPAAVCSPSKVDLAATAVTTGSTSGLTYTYFTDAGATVPLTNPSMVVTGGTYFIKGTNANGCSDVKSVVVTVNAQPVVSTVTQSVCSPNKVDLTLPAVTTGSTAGLTYTYFTNVGATITLLIPTMVATSGTYYIVGTNTSTGCSDTASVIVTIKQPTTSSTIVSNCGTYTWNGDAYTASGTYTKVLTNAVGCDSTATLLLTIKQPTTSSVTASVCGSYIFNGKTLTASGIYEDTLQNVAGCDSLITLNLTISLPITVTITGSTTVCTGETLNLTATGDGTYEWSGPNAFNATTATISLPNAVVAYSGTYTVKVTNANGCTANATTLVTVNAVPITPTVQANVNTPTSTNITLTATGCAGTLLWYNALDNTSVTMPISPSVTTSYYTKCEVTANGITCTSPASGNVKVTVGTLVIITIKTGNWEDTTTWNVGRLPLITEEVTIDSTHIVTITTATQAIAKKLIYKTNATLNFGNSSAKLTLESL
jgi:hypothetical protein